jgi:nucleoside-diphosphate-sugar epimerase
MNLVTSLTTYAAMSRELGLPLRFPGTKEGWNTLQDTTDAELFGRATLWALDADKARNQIFNVSNGDVYRWRQLWKELAAFYDLPVAEPLAMSTVSEISEKAPLCDSMVTATACTPRLTDRSQTGRSWTGCSTSARKQS